MSKFRTQKNSFIAGEISPTALGRTDLPQYPHASEEMLNVIPLPGGGAYGRPGSLYQGAVNATTHYAPRLIPFVVSKTEAYCVAITKASGGNGTMQIYRPTDNKSVPSAASLTGTHPWLQATATTVASTGDYYDDWHSVQYVQSVDVMRLVHPRFKPYKLSRTAADTFTLVPFDNGLTGAAFRDAWPYRAQNSTAITLEINTATVGTGRTLTASAAFFVASHVGAVFKWYNGSTYGCCRVTAFTDSTHVTVEVMVAFSASATPSATWWESAWSDYRGWPRSIAMFQQRVAYGGNATERDTIWFTEANDFDQLSHDSHVDPYAGGTPTGDNAFAATIASQELNHIQWLSAEKTLLAGTLGDEYIVDYNRNAATGFGADNIVVSVESHYGSAHKQPVRIAGELAFCRSSQDEIRALVFNESEDSYIAEPVQTLFDHYPKPEKGTYKLGDRNYRTFAWDEYRSTLWCCDTMGNLFGMTRDRRLQMTAWHPHRMGGFNSSLTGGTLHVGADIEVDPAYAVCAGSVVSLTVIPNPINGGSDLWLAVKRKINNAFTYHIERIIGKEFRAGSAYDPIPIGTYLVDAATYNLNDFPGSEDYVFSGHDHLEGETLVGTASNVNGLFTITGSAVSSGDTTIQPNYPTDLDSILTIVSFGLGFNSIIKPVRGEAGSQIGSAQGAIKRVHECNIRFYNTLHAKVGSSADNLETITFREGDTDMGDSAELFTGDKLVKLESHYDRDGYVYLLKDKPLPFCVVSISTEGVLYD